MNIPAEFSSTGKRRRLFFDTKGAAEAEAARIRRFRKEHGTKSAMIRAGLAVDALKAAEVLAPHHGTTLVAAARFYAEHLEAQSKSVTFSELLAAHLERIESKSDKYQSNASKIGSKVESVLGSQSVASLSPTGVETALTALFPTAHGLNSALSVLSPMFSHAVRKGWCGSNPCAGVERRDTGRHEIDFLTTAETKSLLAACRDYRKDKRDAWPELLKVDARDAAVPVAILLFAGIRPTELTRLVWDDVKFDHGVIRVPARHSKTGTARTVEIEENLKLWLKAVPEGERVGAIIPANWKRKWQAVRKEAGIEKRQADIARHSYASHWLCAYDDVDALRSRMGHRTTDVLFRHYHAVVTKRDALAFWKIVPDQAEEPSTVKVA